MALELQTKKSHLSGSYMIMYLASGFSVMHVKGREQELAKMMPVWNRLHSYHYVNVWLKDTLEMLKEDRE